MTIHVFLIIVILLQYIMVSSLIGFTFKQQYTNIHKEKYLEIWILLLSVIILSIGFKWLWYYGDYSVPYLLMVIYVSCMFVGIVMISNLYNKHNWLRKLLICCIDINYILIIVSLFKIIMHKIYI